MPTLSTSLKTRRKLSPANFLRSSIVHIPLARSVANSSGYCDTSSSPLGVLKQEKNLSSYQTTFINKTKAKEHSIENWHNLGLI